MVKLKIAASSALRLTARGLGPSAHHAHVARPGRCDEEGVGCTGGRSMGAVRSDEVELDSNDDTKLRRRTAAATMTRSQLAGGLVRGRPLTRIARRKVC